MDCPKCIGRLQKRDIQVDETHNVKELEGAGLSFTLEVDQCFVCGGVWFDKGELDKYTTERITVIDSNSIGADMDRALDKKEGKCPRCGVIMKQTPYEKDTSVTIDVCEKCGGIWLDSTEIDRLEKDLKGGFLGNIMRFFHKNR